MTNVATYSGNVVPLLSPTPYGLPIPDMIRSIARIPRYIGHTIGHIDEIYSVAQHSVFTSYIVETEDHPECAYAALIHDLHEGLTGDIISPFKEIIGSKVDSVQNHIQAAIHERLGLPWPLRKDTKFFVKMADIIALNVELYDLLPNTNFEHIFPTRPEAYEVLKPMRPSQAYELFINRFNELCPEEFKVEAA